MGDESISVLVDGKKITIYKGMRVKHALLALDETLYKAAQRGDLLVLDEFGFEVGLEGALREGAKITTRRVS